MPPPKKSFHETLRETRERAQQSAEVMSILLSMEEADYLALELGTKLPDNETLKRLCMMMEWNYYDTRRMIANQIAAPSNSEAVPGKDGAAVMEALQRFSIDDGLIRESKNFDTLGMRLKDVRLQTGQDVEIIAMLLNIEPAAYRKLESGEHPTGDLLQRISIIYDWNYYDLISLLRSEKAKDLQPRQMGNPFPGTSPHLPRLKTILNEMEGLFSRIPDKEQQMILSQLELVRETMNRAQPVS